MTLSTTSDSLIEWRMNSWVTLRRNSIFHVQYEPGDTEAFWVPPLVLKSTDAAHILSERGEWYTLEELVQSCEGYDPLVSVEYTPGLGNKSFNSLWTVEHMTETNTVPVNTLVMTKDRRYYWKQGLEGNWYVVSTTNCDPHPRGTLLEESEWGWTGERTVHVIYTPPHNQG